MVKLICKKIGINGEGIGYINRMPVFCDGIFPGEIGGVEIIEQKKTYAKANLIKLLKTCKDRRPAKCRYQKECGACPLMPLHYNKQLEYKVELLKEALLKYSNVCPSLIRKMHGSQDIFSYRNQCKLPIQERNGKLVAGMYKPKSNHFLAVSNCLVHTKEVEDIKHAVLKILNKYQCKAFNPKTKHGIRYLIIRSLQGHSQCTLITGKDTLPKDLITELKQIPTLDVLAQSINTDLKTIDFFGSSLQFFTEQTTIPYQLTNDITLSLSPQAFFQLNDAQAMQLYQTAIAKIDPCEELVEAYCGIGAMSFLAKDKANHITGIEVIPEAIENAKETANTYHLSHIDFMAKDAVDGLYRIARLKQIDTLLVDPPRSGLSDEMIQAIKKTNIQRFIYISCNPATLAKNLNDLDEYKVLTIIPFDLFPNTPHVETVVLMSRI